MEVREEEGGKVREMPAGLLFYWKASYLKIFEGITATVMVTLQTKTLQ